MSDTGRTFEVRIRGIADPDQVAGVSKLDVLEQGDLVMEDGQGSCVGSYARGECISAVVLPDKDAGEAGE